MNPEQEDQELRKIAQKMVTLFEELFAACDWNSSLFIRNAVKPLHELHKEAEQILHQLSADASAAKAQNQEILYPTARPGYIKVFISLYQSEGANLQKWQSVLKNMVGQVVNRPVYREEAHVLELLRSKSDAMRQAYAVVYVPEVTLISSYQGKASVDQFGHELLTLKDNAVKLENIIEFVHLGKRYPFVGGKLSA